MAQAFAAQADALQGKKLKQAPAQAGSKDHQAEQKRFEKHGGKTPGSKMLPATLAALNDKFVSGRL